MYVIIERKDLSLKEIYTFTISCIPKFINNRRNYLEYDDNRNKTMRHEN